jgi:hypothetical protein
MRYTDCDHNSQELLRLSRQIVDLYGITSHAINKLVDVRSSEQLQYPSCSVFKTVDVSSLRTADLVGRCSRLIRD